MSRVAFCMVWVLCEGPYRVVLGGFDCGSYEALQRGVGKVGISSCSIRRRSLLS